MAKRQAPPGVRLLGRPDVEHGRCQGRRHWCDDPHVLVRDTHEIGLLKIVFPAEFKADEWSRGGLCQMKMVIEDGFKDDVPGP